VDGLIGRRMTCYLLRRPTAAPDAVARLPRPAAAAQQSLGWEPSRDHLSVASQEQCGRVVERSFAWFARFRRLARDYERLPETLAGLHFLAAALLMLKSFVTLVAQYA